MKCVLELLGSENMNMLRNSSCTTKAPFIHTTLHACVYS